MTKLKHGGARPNAGAKPKGHILYQRRFKPELVEKMDLYLEELKINATNETLKRIS